MKLKVAENVVASCSDGACLNAQEGNQDSSSKELEVAHEAYTPTSTDNISSLGVCCNAKENALLTGDVVEAGNVVPNCPDGVCTNAQEGNQRDSSSGQTTDARAAADSVS